jgi:hypothetical protein
MDGFTGWINIHFTRFSSLPAVLYYAQHGYTEQDEVDILQLKRNFGKSCHLF